MSKKISIEIGTDDALSDIDIKDALEYYGWKDVLNEIHRKVGSSDIIDSLIDKGYKVEKE